jgi:hypothetical protein
MKTEMNVNERSITSNFISRILYALQVIVIAIAIPVLSYMEMTHVEKPDTPTEKTSISLAAPEAEIIN